MKSKIYQIYYDINSKEHCYSGLLKYNNSSPVKPNEFEYGVMRDIYFNKSPFVNNYYLGVLSWKFQQKTNLHPSKIIPWLHKTKADVYTINPFPQMKTFENVWKQGEAFHPGMSLIVEDLFQRADLDLTLLTLPHSPKVSCYCNYWIANERFWNLYMSYTEKLYSVIYESGEQVFEDLFLKKADKEIDSGMFSFIMERMFSSVLAKHQEEFKISPYYT